jgi:hypothetical protein
MNYLKHFFRFFIVNKHHIEDMKPLTEFLKNNDTFKKSAIKIHTTKETIKGQFTGSLDKLLKEEDELKFIEDDKKNKRL